ncbi:Adenine phosphoribosyltransferase [Toxocara canis]|uniref:Adenine phosphoribosyltransferase n=1 Tax=Toxocara canis TaxID=6265 RepID=A0A0B2VLH1_TOXCA|nr:Adenine phosphoribosyltransferase [Toxocara canis]
MKEKNATCGTHARLPVSLKGSCCYGTGEGGATVELSTSGTRRTEPLWSSRTQLSRILSNDSSGRMAKRLMTSEGESLSVKNKRQLQHLKEEVKGQLRFFEDFPKRGINFVDVMVLMRHPALLNELCHAVAEHARAEIPVAIDAVAGLEARG